MERLKFAQQKRAEDALREQEQDEEEGSFADAHSLQTLQRKVSTVHSLAAYSRPPGLPCPPPGVGVGGVAPSSGGMMGIGGRRCSSAMGAGRYLVRSGSLLGGSGGVAGTGSESSGQVKSNKGFFFDTRAKGDPAAETDQAQQQQVKILFYFYQILSAAKVMPILTCFLRLDASAAGYVCRYEEVAELRGWGASQSAQGGGRDEAHHFFASDVP